jgi:hypothetical protein
MVERVSSPLSLQAVAQATTLPLNSPRFASLNQQANELGIDELGLYDNWLAWRGAIHQRVSKAYPFFDQFWERYSAFSARYDMIQVILPSDPPLEEEAYDRRHRRMEEFLYAELQAFIHEPTAQAQERNAILAALCDNGKRPASLEVSQRLQEVCFLPGFIFPWCLSTAQFWNDVKKETRKERDRLRALHRHIQADPLLSDTLKERIQREVETLCELLQEQFPQPSQLDAWRKQLGIDKSVDSATQKHRIWSCIFKELVDWLRPFCSGPKHLHLAKTPTAMPEQAFQLASRLIHLSHPDLWPDRPDLVKGRYYSAP